jgi:hypothetical protein
MKITLKFLNKYNACNEGVEFVKQNNVIGLEAPDFIKKLIELDKTEWANWLIVRVLDKINCVRYAVFAAEQVLPIFEEEYPDDNRPRKAIEAAKAYIENPCEATSKAVVVAENAANAAWSARVMAGKRTAAESAANAAAHAAESAANIFTVYASAFAAANTAYAAAYADCDKILIKIVNYGIELLRETSK